MSRRSTGRDAVDAVVGAEVAVPEREIGPDDEPQRELEASAESHVRRQLQLEREGVGQTAVVAAVGATRWKVSGRVVVIRDPVVHRVSHRHLQRHNGVSQSHSAMKKALRETQILRARWL